MVSQVKVQSGGQGYRSVADNESGAASSEVTSLPETFDLVADVPNWSISGNRTSYGRMLDARQFARMFLEGRSKTLAGRCGMRQDTDTGAWERGWWSMRQKFASIFGAAGSFAIRFVLHVDEVAYLSR